MTLLYSIVFHRCAAFYLDMFLYSTKIWGLYLRNVNFSKALRLNTALLIPSAHTYTHTYKIINKIGESVYTVFRILGCM